MRGTLGTYRRTRLAVCLALTVILAGAAGLLTAQPVQAASNFVIEDYDIDMQVNEDDTYLITETIDVHFTAPSHGIYRTIPYRMDLDRDGQRTRCYGKVTEFEMLSAEPVEEEKGSDSYFFRIGAPNKYADEDTTYKLSYIFDMRGDHLRGADEVFYNLIGTGWEARAIQHVSFRITFPKPIDMNNVGIKTGNQVEVPFEADGDRTITGETGEDTLGGLTIRAVLPQDYFTRQAGTSNLLFYILIVVMGAATGWGFLLWRRHGRDPQIVEVEEFYPPEGLSAPEVGYMESGEIKGEHITSLLLTLADKGYLQITEKEQPGILNKKKLTYEITQLREYDGTSEDEWTFMTGLFMHGARRTVAVDELKNHFYTTIDEIRESITERYRGELWDDDADTWSWILRGIGLLGMVAMFVFSRVINGSPFFADQSFLVTCVLHACEVILPVVGFYGIADWINKPRKSLGGFVLGFIGRLLMILAGFAISLLFDTCMGAQIPAYLLGMGMIFILYLMAALCERKTDEYAALLGRIRGYKRFLQVAEKERMEMLAEQDPGYFYRNLAYAYAMGVTSVYAERFAPLASEPPRWYVSPYYMAGNAFNTIAMMSAVDSMMSNVSSGMTSTPASGGGSFAGGGGAGGGGGGSW